MTKAELMDLLEDVPDDEEVVVVNKDTSTEAEILDTGVHDGKHAIYISDLMQ